MRMRVYRPKGPPGGSLLLIPGLHFAGPDDPRLDRFAAILADAGRWVFAPFLPDFLALRVEPRLVDDAERALDALLATIGRPPGRPAVFSISFGSFPALRLAAARPGEIASLVVFGGFADWEETMRFCLNGAPGFPHDPLNRPVVFLNLLDAPDAVAHAWRAFVVETWGRPEMKADAAWRPVAERLAAALDPSHRLLFRQGCGLAPGARLIDDALESDRRPWLDPRPHLASLRSRVHLVHGRDDDVIPFTQSQRLAESIPHARVLLTGLYDHTGQAKLRPGTLWRELRTMVAIVRALAAS